VKNIDSKLYHLDLSPSFRHPSKAYKALKYESSASLLYEMISAAQKHHGKAMAVIIDSLELLNLVFGKKEKELMKFLRDVSVQSNNHLCKQYSYLKFSSPLCAR
jgi:hypothetical protein